MKGFKNMTTSISMPRNSSYTKVLSGNKPLEGFLLKAVDFYGKELMTTRMFNTLKIKVHVRKTVLKRGVSGAVINNCKGSIKQNEYLITLDYNESCNDILKTLAHEMVHVMQIATKKLQYRYWKSDKKLHFRWNGEEMGELSKFPYRNQPHEIEAKERQDKLFMKFYYYFIMNKKSEQYKLRNKYR